MKLREYILSVVAIVILPILASCRNELCYNHYPSLDMDLSWEREWERDYGQYHADRWDTDFWGNNYDFYRPGVPEWVNMVCYFPDGHTSETFMSPYGEEIRTSAGDGRTYLLYNGDTEYIVLSDIASLSDARATATTRSRASLSYVMERHPDSRTMNPPDVLFSAYLENVPEIKNHELFHMPVKMQPLVFTYVVVYEFEHGLEHVALARGALGGMAESVYLRTGTTSEKTAIILYDCMMKPYGCYAEVKSFGVPGFPDQYYGRAAPDGKERTYTLNLEVMLKNGKTLEFDFDVSDQLLKQPRGGVIKVSGIRVEDENAGYESGFEVEVNEWGDHDVIDLPVTVTK